MREPSKTQKEIIDYTGFLIVKAPPGSGKTYTLTKKIEKVQNESKKRIVALTFSNKAAIELQDRIRDKKNVIASTIHGFCQEIVISRGYQIGLPSDLRIIGDDKDKLFVIKEVINSSPYLSSQISDYSEKNLAKIAQFISVQKSKFVPPEYFKDLKINNSKLYYEIYDGYVNSMLSQKLLDFDDLLYYSYQILNLEETKSLYKRLYGHLYIDEAQDLNITQYEIIKLLAELVDDVMLIGDPSQSLYGFMGSNKDIMLNRFKDDFDAQIISLKENYRSAKKIVDLINKLNNDNKSLSQFPIEGEVTFSLFENEEKEALAILDKIMELQVEGVKLEEIAVLGRNIYLHNEIKSLFDKEGIEYNIGSAGKITLETQEGNIFLNSIKLLDNPSNGIIKNYFTELFLLENDDVEEIRSYLLQNYTVLFESAKRLFNNIQLFTREIDILIKYYSSLEDVEDEFKYLLINDLNFLKVNWVNYSVNASGNKSLTSFINDMHLGKTQKTVLNGVSLLTVHKSKGLEFDTTFVIGLNEGVLPDYRATEDNISEEDNNAYVAFSRAKRRCYISALETKMMPWGSRKNQVISRYIEKVQDIFDN
ncbi:ATP-dependent helicase [Anaerorhabdus sp.]|uniref:ATP-dependent helicase n=1 Tax=Anaerorhabdus sp. TaxID=1872524 RepID=UPI002B207391|nr:ATP-dependent helicase [Anaerorhabdus sp.]MEA4875657.1 ATP-dependent helicase [Anaerorhabdus sp.]